jgi:hypothetical protein
MTATPRKYTWPKTYLLSLYDAAIKHGFIYVEPIDNEAALSLRMTFLRIRRRAGPGDAASHYIRPEFQLVTVGAWEPGEDNTGRLPIFYQAPASANLPGFRPAASGAVASTSSSYLPAVDLAPAPVPSSPPTSPLADLTMDETEISSYVAKLMAASKDSGQ